MDTDEAMEDASVPIYTTMIMHGECEAKTEHDDAAAESEVLRQADLTKAINRELSEATEPKDHT